MTLSDIQKLIDERVAIIESMQAARKRIDAEKRDPTAEERQTWDKGFADADRLKEKIEDAHRTYRAEAEAASALAKEQEADRNRRNRLDSLQDSLNRGGRIERPDDPAPRRDQTPATRLHGALAPHEQYLRGGRRASDEYRRAFRQLLQNGEVRSLSAGLDVEGGFTVPDEQFLAQLIKFIDDQVFLRRLGTVSVVTGADSLGVPSLEADPADADWTGELLTGSEDSTMQFGKRQLTPHPIAKLLKVSKTLVQRSALPIETIIQQRLAYKFAITEEKGFMTGNGANQPLGIFTPSVDGIPTSRDVSTGSATDWLPAAIYDVMYSVKMGYWPRSAWIMGRTGAKKVRQIRDSSGGAGTGQFMWQPGLQPGQPDTLGGRPLYVSEYASDTFTTGLYVAVFGDFSNYWIAEALNFRLQVLVEAFATTNQNGYIGRQEVDGMPVLAEAFARAKTA